MKKIYLFIMLPVLVASLKVNSQPVLTMANSTPVAGESFTSNICMPVSPVPITNGGASQTWNIAGFTFTQTIPCSIVNPSSTPYFAQFPSATVSAVYQGIYEYYVSSPTDYIFLGNAGTAWNQAYLDFLKLIGFPFSYSDSFTDSFDNGLGNYGNVTVTADGYGSMVFPYGTLNNLLRVHVYSITTSITITDTLFENRYYWYSPGIHYPVCFYNERTILGSTNYVLSYLDPSALGVQSIVPGAINGVALFPNPAHDEITISSIEGFASASIVNMLGQEQKKINRLSATATIYTGDLSRGTYFLKVLKNDEPVYIKFVVE